MRVLHVQKAKGIAGSERHLLELLPRLGDRGVDVIMCVLIAPGGEPFVDALRARGVATVELPAGRDLDPILVARLARLIRSRRPDLVHTHLIHADVHGQVAAALARVPGVRSVHGTTPAFRHQPYRSAAAVSGRLARRTIAISEFAGRYVADHGLAPAGRIRIVPYGIDPAAWSSDEPARARARASLPLAPDEIAVAVASRLVSGKGHGFLISGLARARRQQPSLVLLIAGDGPIRSELEAQARAESVDGAVRFLGYLDEERVRGLMHACDLLAFLTSPSLGEGFGLAALEGSAAGRPVVATNVAALPEIVDDGVTGILVEPGDVGGLADALISLATDPELRRQLGSAGAERARTHFAIDRMIDDTVAVYDEALRPS